MKKLDRYIVREKIYDPSVIEYYIHDNRRGECLLLWSVSLQWMKQVPVCRLFTISVLNGRSFIPRSRVENLWKNLPLNVPNLLCPSIHYLPPSTPLSLSLPLLFLILLYLYLHRTTRLEFNTLYRCCLYFRVRKKEVTCRKFLLVRPDYLKEF